MTDSARWCAVCYAYGDHHTDRHPRPTTPRELLTAMANLIERDGLAHHSYHDSLAGSYCVFGAARIICSGNPFSGQATYMDQVFDHAFDNLAEAVGVKTGREGWSGITSWNDANDQATVVAKLREVAQS